MLLGRILSSLAFTLRQPATPCVDWLHAVCLVFVSQEYLKVILKVKDIDDRCQWMSGMAASCLSSRRRKEVPHVSVVISASNFKGKICL